MVNRCMVGRVSVRGGDVEERRGEGEVEAYGQVVLFQTQGHCCFWTQLCWLLWQQCCSWCQKWGQSARPPAHSLTDFLCHGRYYCSSWYQCRTPVGRNWYCRRVDSVRVDIVELILWSWYFTKWHWETIQRDTIFRYRSWDGGSWYWVNLQKGGSYQRG